MSRRRFETSFSSLVSIHRISWCRLSTMPDQPRVLLIVSLLGAAVTWLLLMLPASNRVERSETIRQRIATAIGTEAARVALLQADLDWLPVRWWIAVRFGVALLSGIVTFALFHLWL